MNTFPLRPKAPVGCFVVTDTGEFFPEGELGTRIRSGELLYDDVLLCDDGLVLSVREFRRSVEFMDSLLKAGLPYSAVKDVVSRAIAGPDTVRPTKFLHLVKP